MDDEGRHSPSTAVAISAYASLLRAEEAVAQRTRAVAEALGRVPSKDIEFYLEETQRMSEASHERIRRIENPRRRR